VVRVHAVTAAFDIDSVTVAVVVTGKIIARIATHRALTTRAVSGKIIARVATDRVLTTLAVSRKIIARVATDRVLVAFAVRATTMIACQQSADFIAVRVHVEADRCRCTRSATNNLYVSTAPDTVNGRRGHMQTRNRTEAHGDHEHQAK